jgi:hypothetical protein
VGKTPSFGGFNLTSFAPKNLLGSGSLAYESPDNKPDLPANQNLFAQNNYQNFI